MDRSTLEKLILAKLPLPADFCHTIKNFFPLNPPTPTAQLMKAVRVTYNTSGLEKHWQIIKGRVLRSYEPEGRWSPPPRRPEILYVHRYAPYQSHVHREIWMYWDKVTGEPAGWEVGNHTVKLIWPALEHGSHPAVSFHYRRAADDMERRVRSWTPVSI